MQRFLRIVLYGSVFLLTSAEAPFEGPVQEHVVRVIDGDTFEASARIWLGQDVDIHVRIKGIDAPELHARCEDEWRKANAAKDYLAQRIEGGEVRLTDLTYDKYGGRVDAVVADGRGDVGASLLKVHLARAYDGGRRAGWCG